MDITTLKTEINKRIDAVFMELARVNKHARAYLLGKNENSNLPARVQTYFREYAQRCDQAGKILPFDGPYFNRMLRLAHRLQKEKAHEKIQK